MVSIIEITEMEGSIKLIKKDVSGCSSLESVTADLILAIAEDILKAEAIATK